MLLEFALLLYKHRSFGWMIRAGLADPMDSTGKRKLERFVQGVAETAGVMITPAISRILELIASFSDQELTRRFAPKGSTVSGFVRNPDPKWVQELIRPFLDRQIDAVLKEALIELHQVYLSDESTYLYPKMKLALPPDAADPVFCFAREPGQTSYALEVYQDEQQIDLQYPGNIIVTNEPCWFCSGDRLLHFPEGFDGKKLQPFLHKKTILIPASAEKEYFRKFILKMAKTGQVRAEGFVVETLKPEPFMVLSVEFDWERKGVLVVYYRYGEHRIMAGKQQKVFTSLIVHQEEIIITRVERDFSWESSVIDRLKQLNLYQTNENTLRLEESQCSGELSLYLLVEWINKYADLLQKMGIVVDCERLSARYFTGSVSADLRVEPGEDWFDVTATVAFGDLLIPFSELRTYILDGIREFPLPGGEIAILPAEWFSRYHDLMWFSRVESEKLYLPLRHMQLIRELEWTSNDRLENRLRELDPGFLARVPVPETLHATLRPYQVEGFHWLRFLHQHRFGGCLADDMGLGKTIQSLTVLLSTKGKAKAASLIVMPASLIHNWQREISRFAPSLSILQHTGFQRAGSAGFFDTVDVVLTTYGILRSDFELLVSYRFDYIILDESQVIKNPEAQTSRVAYQLNSEYRLVLTGTPIENSLTDLWSQMEFLNPGLLGPLPAFRKRFLEKKINNDLNYDEESALKLKRIVAPFILRRTKPEVEPDLPSLTIENWYCCMNEIQHNRYESEKSAVRNEILQQIETGTSSLPSVTVLKALIRLRQLANHPGLIDPEYSGGSGKFDEIIRITEILREEGHKTLVFSSFVKHLQLLASWFDKDGITYSMLTGASVHRDRIIRQFQENPENHFFLISLKAGGTGLNLTQAGYVMLLDPWWNPAAELQAINRAHRIGQDKKVIAYKFITENTIEEKMLKLQQRKQQLSDTFIPSGNPLKDMSREEIKELFG
ncbi:MAG: SNF2 helicase associated domain-containing protein [Bacteroidia bacterium]|nr:SNF2 helicase associated domain-containing protein [Bacteroidia bacterium]